MSTNLPTWLTPWVEALPTPSTLLLLALLLPLLSLLVTWPHFPIYAPFEALAHYHDALPGMYRPWTAFFARHQPGSKWLPTDSTRGLRAVFERERQRREGKTGSRPITAVVTGADGGVGFETTLGLLRAGATVFMGILPDNGAQQAVASVHSMREPPVAGVGPLLGGAHVGDEIVRMRRKQEARRGRVDLTLEAVEARLEAEVGEGEGEDHPPRGRAIPFACDFTTFESTRASARALQRAMAAEEERQRRAQGLDTTSSSSSPSSEDFSSSSSSSESSNLDGKGSDGGSPSGRPAWPQIDYFIGTVGVGHDMPGPKGALSGRYTENDDGLEYQLAINGVNPVLFLMLMGPAFLAGGAADSADPKGGSAGAKEDTASPPRIILINSISHKWTTVPFARAPRYTTCGLMAWDGIMRWTVGRYSFSKLAQLHLFSPLSSLLALAAQGNSGSGGTSGASSRGSGTAASACRQGSETAVPSPPLFFTVHPGEVLTTFIDRILPRWFFSLPCNLMHWINAHLCLSPEEGARTGLYACVVGDEARGRVRAGGKREKPAVPYRYLESMCLLASPSRAARDTALMRNCWAVLGGRMREFLEDVVVGEGGVAEAEAAKGQEKAKGLPEGEAWESGVEVRAGKWERELVRLWERVDV